MPIDHVMIGIAVEGEEQFSLKLPAGHFGMGYGTGAHAPDEFMVVESTNPKIAGFDDAALSYVKFLYEAAATN